MSLEIIKKIAVPTPPIRDFVQNGYLYDDLWSDEIPKPVFQPPFTVFPATLNWKNTQQPKTATFGRRRSQGQTTARIFPAAFVCGVATVCRKFPQSEATELYSRVLKDFSGKIPFSFFLFPFSFFLANWV